MINTLPQPPPPPTPETQTVKLEEATSFKDDLAKLFRSIAFNITHPAVTWTSLVSGLGAALTSKDDWQTLFGMVLGAKVFILAKWFVGACLAQVANGDLYRKNPPQN